MISLSRIIEQQGFESQYYDLGKDFLLFKRSIDGSFEQIKNKFESQIGSKLIGKRIRARASKGFKQYVKDYEFDVTKITLDDYYDNYVVVAHDNSSPKPKEYFLKPGFKITILGPATGQPSPVDKKPTNKNTSTGLQNAPVNELQKDISDLTDSYYDAYSIDDIELDIKKWLSQLVLPKQKTLKDFIPRIGWIKSLDDKDICIFDLKIPTNLLRYKINPRILRIILDNISKDNILYKLNKMEFDHKKDQWNIRIKKIIDKTDKVYE